jgi:hypothetical protein
MHQEFIETHLIGVAVEARKGRLCDMKGILCCASLCQLILFVNLRGEHSNCDKGKILYEINKSVRASRAFVFEVAVWIVASAPFLSDTDCWNASQPTIPKRANNQEWRREGFGTEIGAE